MNVHVKGRKNAGTIVHAYSPSTGKHRLTSGMRPRLKSLKKNRKKIQTINKHIILRLTINNEKATILPMRLSKFIKIYYVLYSGENVK